MADEKNTKNRTETEIKAMLERAMARGKKPLNEQRAELLVELSAFKEPPRPVLNPVKHPQQDFFIADILDASTKDDLASMEHPFFALKAGDMRVRSYERNGNSITIKPGHDGCATIHDKDVWIYCISQLVEAMNRDRSDVSRTVRFTAHDFLVTTNRDIKGAGYKRMGDAMARLSGTRVETNIVTDGQRERAGFGLIDSWRVIEKTSGGRMVAIEVTLSDWLYRSVKAKQVLTLSPDYFRIRKPIDRRIYELARKHCGDQRQWQCTLKTLFEKSGSTDAFRNFRGVIKALAESNDLPDYQISMTDDMVTFLRK
jgi:plasmid replication initiation protein